jgi:cell fate regulator YaaT (PSP1 superfamily)
VYYFSPADIENLEMGEHVVVQTARGEEVGQVVISPCQVSDREIVGHLKDVRRRATALDLTEMAYYRFKEHEALERCQEKAEAHRLPMKIVRAEYSYDGSRLVFYFAAEKRVDFRKLLQDLARSFKARIELRQIGVRDEAKLTGGIGRCGRTLCCVTWLTEFNPVSIKMAKQQELPLSPMEISGLCGRLLCCLAYENQQYIDAKKELPKRNEIIDTPRGRGKVVHVDYIKESVQVELENQVTIEVTKQELLDQAPARSQPRGPARRQRRRRRPKR